MTSCEEMADVAVVGLTSTPVWTAESSPSLRRLISERVIDQLRQQTGTMPALGREDSTVMLDWVEGVSRLLASETALEGVEAEAAAILESGTRHVIWAGMGGSIMTVRVLADLGFNAGGSQLTIHCLDSTDPAALTGIVSDIARAKGLAPLAARTPDDPDLLRRLLGDVMLVGASMGMTSEEPITHLIWFLDLIAQAQLSPAEHVLIMTLPDSYLDRFAAAHHLPAVPLQLDGRAATAGRMSAPTTRVFLLPAALALAQRDRRPGQLRAILRRAWQTYNLPLASEHPGDHPYVRLAAALADASRQGVVRLLLAMPGDAQALLPWIEQLMEESLGKDGKGVLVFDDQVLRPEAPAYSTDHTIRVAMVANVEHVATGRLLDHPDLASSQPQDRLAALAASFLGWQLSMALYGYLQGITFAGQPAVENYKARARALRSRNEPLQAALEEAAVIEGGPLTLLAPPAFAASHVSAAATFAAALGQAMAANEGLTYLDLTFNGEFAPALVRHAAAEYRALGNHLLGVPVKVRRAPAAYHSTEQSEMAGPPGLVSLRVIARHHPESMLGSYDDAFLSAQAVGTWQAMTEQGRCCFLLLLEEPAPPGADALTHFIRDVAAHLAT